MIKRFLYLGLISLSLVSCLAKKKTTYAKKEKTKREVSVPASNPKPIEDTGRFKYYPIASTEEYITVFAPIAQSEMKQYGIPASITLAQGLLESGAGRGQLTRRTNNHFGIKCHKGWTGGRVYHDDDAKGECFRKYNNPNQSFRDHSEFLSSRSRYAFLFEYKPTDYRKWAYGLRKAGYATDRKYPQKLMALIERHELHKYDREVIARGDYTPREVPDGDRTIHIVAKGETLYAISRRYFISVDELMALNKLKTTTLQVGQQLIVKKRR
jgi:flagellum-specific peptidoglycan hydrolase FlgJ